MRARFLIEDVNDLEQIIGSNDISEVAMRVAFVIVDGMTALGFVGVYDPVTWLRSMGILPDRSIHLAVGLIFCK